MINRLINEIENSLQNGNYLIALMAALTLPDICGKAEYPNEQKPSIRYIRWYDEWIGKSETYKDSKTPFPTGGIVYELRCSFAHEGSPKVHEKNNNLTSFKLVNNKPWICGGSAMVCDNGERELEINARNLIWKLCTCSKSYYEKNKEKFKFLENVQIDF